MLAAAASQLKAFDPRAAATNVQTTFEEDPTILASMFTWFVTGTVLYLLGLFIFLFSEINAVLITRDSDFRLNLITKGYAEKVDGPEYKKQESRELRKLEPRPYLTVFGIIVLFFAISCLLFPLCQLIEILGLPSAPCILIITVGAAFAAICNATFYLFLVWSCTRTYASLIFLLISVSGSILLPAGNPILLILWVAIAFGSWYTYFFYLPSLYTDDKPAWLQDIGKYGLLENNAAVDDNITKFTGAIRTGAEVIQEEVQESIEAARKKAEEMAEAARKQAEAAAEEARKAAEAAADAAKKQAEAAAAAAKPAEEAKPADAPKATPPKMGLV
jgi:ElaB/YqjD/DUF883 family membrane-anchored ribosome-binding protein